MLDSCNACLSNHDFGKQVCRTVFVYNDSTNISLHMSKKLTLNGHTANIYIVDSVAG